MPTPNIFYKYILLLIVGFTADVALCQSGEPLTLQQAIKITLERNPATLASDLDIQAMEEDVKAAYLGLWPTVTLSYFYLWNQGSANEGQGDRTFKNRDGTGHLGVSWNLYSGGANLAQARATEARKLAMEALYNSTYQYGDDTKGSIVSSCFLTYKTIVLLRAAQDYVQELRAKSLRMLELARGSGDTSNENLVKGLINDFETTYMRNGAELSQFERKFQNVAKIPAPAFLQSFEEMILGITIPKTPEEALTIAGQKNPDIQRRTFNLEAEKYDAEAVRARSRGLSVDASVGRNLSTGNILGLGDYSRAGTLGTVSVSWTLDVAGPSRSKAADLRVQTAVKKRQYDLEKIQFQIESLYPRIISQEKLVAMYKEHLVEASLALNASLEKLAAASPKEFKQLLQDTLKFISDESKVWDQTVNGQDALLQLRFEALQVMGTLYDDLNVADVKVLAR